jgi:beta-glucanase (GH16 family)
MAWMAADRSWNGLGKTRFGGFFFVCEACMANNLLLYATCLSGLIGTASGADDWTRVGPLGDTPAHVRADLPLSDQQNRGHWALDPQFSDEFNGNTLDASRWHLVAPGKPEEGIGPAPSVFVHENATVSDGLLKIVFRKQQVPFMKGNPDFAYTTALVRSQERTRYGYYETRAKAMDSGASSGFFLHWTGLPDNATEIDIFEIGGRTTHPEFDRAYHMHAHVWRTPTSDQHLDVGKAWTAPWRLAEAYHVYGFDWSAEKLVWYVDGVKVREAPNTHWFFPMQLVFDSEAMWAWFGPVDDAYLPSTFDIDYVRVWRQAD